VKLLLAAFALMIAGCTQAQAQSADAFAIDLTNAICAPLEGQPAGQPYVDVVCTLAQGVEQTVGGVVSVLSTKTVQVRLPAAEAPAFLASHRM